MNFRERNNLINDMLVKYRELHNKYTIGKRILEDPDWEDYIHSMDDICAEHKGTNLELLAGKLCMAFLDDTEYVQKKLKERG